MARADAEGSLSLCRNRHPHPILLPSLFDCGREQLFAC